MVQWIFILCKLSNSKWSTCNCKRKVTQCNSHESCDMMRAWNFLRIFSKTAYSPRYTSRLSFNLTKWNLTLEDNPFYKLPTVDDMNNQNRYREYNILFSSNSCNFITATNRAKTDCPKGHVFCNKTSSPLLADTKMTFVDAVEHCGKLNTTICKLNMHSKCFRVKVKANSNAWPPILLMSSDSPESFNDVAGEFEKRNLTKAIYIIWTDFERVDFINFRWKFLRNMKFIIMNVQFRFSSKSSGRIFNASQLCQACFYNVILSHGDGSIKNYPDRELCQKSDFKNDDPIGFCICRYIDLFIAFYIFSFRSGFNVRYIPLGNSNTVWLIQ